jgi:hypothetical protein
MSSSLIDMFLSLCFDLKVPIKDKRQSDITHCSADIIKTGCDLDKVNSLSETYSVNYICLFIFCLFLKHLQCLRKVFRPLDFFNILLNYSLIPKWIKYFFSSAICTQYPIMTTRKPFFIIFC